MNLNLSGLNALVAGSTQGIGKAAAIELAQLGANVTLIARNADTLLIACSELPLVHNKQVHGHIVADFSNTTKLRKIISEYVQDQNGFHILINNTGGPPSGNIETEPVDNFQKAIEQHLYANHILAQTVIPFMKQQKYGRIINIVSTSVKEPIKGLGVSNTIRAAVASWAKTLSFELASHGINVNNVLPGATNTQRLSNLIAAKAIQRQVSEEAIKNELISAIPAKRFADPYEIAALIAFLASPAASYITGQSIAVDGGRMNSI